MVKRKSKKLPRLYQIYAVFLEILPAALYFSYFPVIGLGANESMNFELSLPLIWLVLFDALGVGMVVWGTVTKKIFQSWREAGRAIWHNWLWLLLPVLITLSIVWSLNPVRGVLTTGILWLIYLAVFVMAVVGKRIEFPEHFWRDFWRWFFGASLVAAAWCWLQCVLDLVGLGQEYTLMCNGCVVWTFGFPHPNGLAIEPQFMGNLLLAPTLLAGWFAFGRKKYWPLFLVLTATLFLTFSRGAIYAFVVGLALMTVLRIVQTKRWQTLGIWLGVAIAFLFTLNVQGVMAAVGPTNETYLSGIAKAVHQLSLGVVDVRGQVAEMEGTLGGVADEQSDEATGEGAIFDGYVAESTNARVRLNDAALTIWRDNPKNMLIGVGIGGAGQALYDYGLSPAPKEIVQNEYLSLLLEIGLIGIVLVVLTLVLSVRALRQSPLWIALLAVGLAFMVSLCFFSGLANALQIYLLPVLIATLPCGRNWSDRH